MRWLASLVLIVLLSACNLSDQPAGLVTPATFAPIPTEPTEAGTPAPPSPSALPGITLQPNSATTRTPFGSNSGAPTPLATQPTGESAVISAPSEGATVSSPLVVSGTVSNLPENAFTLQLVSADGDVLNSQAITLQNPANAADIPWSASMLVSRFTGAAQVRIVGRTTDNRDALLAAVSVTVGAQTAGQPSASGGASGSSLGSITIPSAGSTTSSDPIIVQGTAGNFPETTFTLALMTREGVILNSQVVTINGGAAQRVPWAAALGTGGYRGAVEIRAFLVRDGQNVPIASVNVNVG